MHCDPDKYRLSIRLRGYDYSQSGAYFVTICAQNRECLFGDIIDREMKVNEFGEIVQNEWTDTANHRSNLQLDYFVIMPNHFHCILVIDDFCRGTACRARNEPDQTQYMGTARRAPTMEQFAKPVAGSLPTIVRSFKSAVTKQINQIRNTPGYPVWQRNYYEHILRNEEDMNRIRNYITNNPAKWDEDEDNPANIIRSRGEVSSPVVASPIPKIKQGGDTKGSRGTPPLQHKPPL